MKLMIAALIVFSFFMCDAIAQTSVGSADSSKVFATTDSNRITYSSDSSKVYTKPALYPVVRIAKPVTKPKPPKPITHEWSLGLRLNTNGWGIFSDFGKVKTNDFKKADLFHNLIFWQLEFGEKKDPKEQKVAGQTNKFGGSHFFKYGKINNFYTLKLGMGYSKLLAGKPDPGCVSIHWNGVAGFSLGLLKPYYLLTYSDPNAIKYSDITQSDFLDLNGIKGSAGFSKGLGEMQFVPGGHIKTSLHFDFSADKKYIIGAETGVNAEFYSQPIPLMAGQSPSSSFFEMFLALQLGTRW